jgi:3-hydroxyacyl-[acyl-carrier-protein] dehydratase
VDYENRLRSHRRKQLFDVDSLPTRLKHDRQTLSRIIPQRDPVLLVDELIGLDLDRGLIAGRRVVRADDPVFMGHFPDYPVYPGSYTLEMIGQLSLCLYHFLEEQTTTIAADASPAAVRATRLMGAYFLQPIRPDDNVLLIAEKTENDGYFARAVGQAIVDGKVCCVTAGEVCFL